VIWRSREWSLRVRLLLIAALACFATVVAGGSAMFWAAQQEDDRMLDSRLQDLARTVMSFAEHEIGEILEEGRASRMHVETAATLGSRYRYQIWSLDGTLLLYSHQASEREPLLPLAKSGFATVREGDEEFRVFAMRGRGEEREMVIQVAECLDDRESPVVKVSVYFLAFLILPITLILAITWWLLRRSLAAIDSSAAQLSVRSPIDLTPLHTENPPRELKPIIQSINTLFERIERTLSLERGFTAVAAHELRTPLAGLRAQAQIAGSASTPEELSEALAAVMLGVDRAAHLLNQLLDLARVDSLSGDPARLAQPIDIRQAFEAVMDDLGQVASKRNLKLSWQFDAPRLHAVDTGLILLLRNALANAFRHTPIGGQVEVSTTAAEDGIVLRIDDSGPGIAEADRERAFERFGRLGASDSDGVGLGMSIIQSVVVAHRAMIRLLHSPLGGLRMEIHFPAT
jgi:signal transduction histidine kinase